MAKNLSDSFLKCKELADFVYSPEEKKDDYISTNVISLNLLFSGRPFGGIQKGAISMMSAGSSQGKSFVGLSILKEAQKRGMECYVFDAEKSFDYNWAKGLGINVDPKVLPVIGTSEISKIKQAISMIEDGKNTAERANVFVLLDSWGTLVSQVMIDKAADGSTTRDMTLGFWKNELANIMKESGFTYFVINHVYDSIGGFGDPLQIPGGRRLYFNSENVVLTLSKAKDKTTSGEITGAIMTAMTHKGRKALEKSKLKYRIKHEGGLDFFYGLLDDALEFGVVVKPKNGAYARPCVPNDVNWKENEIYCPEFWVPIFKNTDFENKLIEKYTYSADINIGSTSLDDLMSSDYSGAKPKKTVKKDKIDEMLDEDE